jgi:hypothetical protein
LRVSDRPCPMVDVSVFVVYSNTRIVPKYRAAPWTFLVKSVLPVTADQATLNSISYSRQIHSQIKTTSRRAMDVNQWRYDASNRRDAVGGAVERSYVGDRRRHRHRVTQWGGSQYHHNVDGHDPSGSENGRPGQKRLHGSSDLPQPVQFVSRSRAFLLSAVSGYGAAEGREPGGQRGRGEHDEAHELQGRERPRQVRTGDQRSDRVALPSQERWPRDRRGILQQRRRRAASQRGQLAQVGQHRQFFGEGRTRSPMRPLVKETHATRRRRRSSPRS